MRWKHRGEDYETLKQRLSDRLRAELERHVPAVVGNIACTEFSTPVTTRHFTNYRHGEIYGLSSTPERFAVRGLGARTPIRGLYLTGQDVGCVGVVGSLFGGVVTASAALGKNLLARVSKPGGSHPM
jgi:all-trans-retinol 13,14-reductase